MLKERYAKLTSAIFELLEFFPDGEALKQKIREKAMHSLEALATEKNQAVLEDIEVITSYLYFAKERGWISRMNLMITLKEYKEIKELLGEKQPVDNNVNKKEEDVKLSDRKLKILEILKDKGKAQVSDIQKILVNVSKRTLRRDLDELLKTSKVKRFGEWNQVVYTLGQTEKINENDRTFKLS